MFDQPKLHKHAIPLNGHDGLTDDFHEIARFWVSSERSFILTAPDVVGSPYVLGSLIGECLYTAAAGYAHFGAMTESEALAELWRGLDEERSRLAAEAERPN